MIVAVAAAARDAALVSWCADVGRNRGGGEHLSDESVIGKKRRRKPRYEWDQHRRGFVLARAWTWRVCRVWMEG